ncbi:MAG: beta-N-acetylglucosaminidase domain-containing protein [Desulfobacterales bacterium]|nr:MAG: beta-N-acetylglucosaminidase domain-containing protein [Desulfobacterales bacterium]
MFLLLAGTTVLSGCAAIDREITKYGPAEWSGSKPSSIPYENRLRQFKRGNLVPNPSFEEGRVTTDDPANTFTLQGWQKVGQNVEWTDRDSGAYAADEVSTGKHAVKILRKKAGELDDAEGIISDYISVIPGNYYFSYKVRLKRLISHKYRQGVPLQDALVIKVLFFDGEKQPVNPADMNPVSQTDIDSSDKGYSFSNYWTVNDFPWSRVRGRTYNYPYAEGDVPDRTRYVRLFLGLKGSGAMWLDDIVFRYSKWNFTALERFKPYFDRPLSLEESIVPTPKHIQKLNDIVFYDPQSGLSPPLIVLPENPAAAERAAAKILQQKIQDVICTAVPAEKTERLQVRILKKELTDNDLVNVRLIFSIGRNSLLQQIQPDLPLQSIQDKQQGYVIKAEKIGNTPVVFLNGETPLGTYYAAATAVQLFENNKCVYHNATVIDYPDFLGRSYVFKKWANTLELENDISAMGRMSLYKLNKVYLGYNRNGRSWYHIDALYLKGIEDAGNWCRENGVISLAMMVNPYSHLGFQPSAEHLNKLLRYTFTHDSPQSLDMLKNIYRVALDAGADTIMLQADDSVPHIGRNRQNYSLYTEEDKKRFINLQNAQAHVITQLKQWLDREYPGTRMEFCPPWYSNEHVDRSQGQAEQYFKDLAFQIPREVAVVWTGPTIRSLSIDMADLYRYKQFIGRWPMIWDNTLYARNLKSRRYGGYPAHYPGKVKLCNLFEPFDTYRPDNFQNYNDGRQMYTNGAASSEVYRIKYATVADYEWNTAAYNPELSLWKVLCRQYGPAVARELLLFNNAYYDVYETCLGMESQGVTAEYIKRGNKYLAAMDEHIANISAALPGSNPLVKELENFREEQKKRFHQLSQAPKNNE